MSERIIGSLNIYSKIKKAVREGGVPLVFTRLLKKIWWSFVRPNYLVQVLHNFNDLPKEDVQFRHLATQSNDILIAERILLALKKAQKDEHKNIMGDLWDNIQRDYHSDFYAIYNDPAKVAEYMNNMNQHGITWGISSSCIEDVMAISKSPSMQQEWGVMIKDALVSFAEAVCVLPRNLNAGNLLVDEGLLLSNIEGKIGISLSPSNIEGGLYKLKINNKFFDCNDFISAYTAFRVHSLVGSDASIAEIGGGMGKAALYAEQFGITNYFIYDLPIINLVQAWFLIKSGVDVVLYGEQRRPHVLHILPYWEFKKESFDLTLNVNSFPEMDGSIVAEYLKIIKKNTSKYLLSINLEDGGEYGEKHVHIVVQDIVTKVKGLNLIYRFPSWFMRNYVEELYKVD